MKFLTDAMFGKLTRLLRILGYDTVYADDLEEYFQKSPVLDDELAQYAKETDRIIITRDYPFYKKYRNRSIYLDGVGVYNYLDKLKNSLQLEYNFDINQARCSLCNSNLEKVKNINLIKDKVKVETYKHYKKIFQCKNQNCKKVFWKGTHIENILKRLEKK